MYKKLKTNDFASVAEAILYDLSTHKENRRLVMSDLKETYTLVKADKDLVKEAKIDYLEAKILYKVAKGIFKTAKSVLDPYVKDIWIGSFVSSKASKMPKNIKTDHQKSEQPKKPSKILMSKSVKKVKDRNVNSENHTSKVISNIIVESYSLPKKGDAANTQIAAIKKVAAHPSKIKGKPAVIQNIKSTSAVKPVESAPKAKAINTASKVATNASKTVKGSSKSSNVSDLKLIEGIGPKIEQILNASGIKSFADLVAAPGHKVQTILESAGNRFKMHNPATWQEQAKLADKGSWDALKKLQDSLKGGKR